MPVACLSWRSFLSALTFVCVCGFSLHVLSRTPPITGVFRQWFWVQAGRPLCHDLLSSSRRTNTIYSYLYVFCVCQLCPIRPPQPTSCTGPWATPGRSWTPPTTGRTPTPFTAASSGSWWTRKWDPRTLSRARTLSPAAVSPQHSERRSRPAGRPASVLQQPAASFLSVRGL